MIKTLNLEVGNPTTQTAIQKLKNSLSTYKRQGCKAVIVIHGYGASGVGGSIRHAVRTCLRDTSMVGIVRMSVAGEDWLNKKRDAISLCGALANPEHQIEGNQGKTVVVLQK